jgi:EAL domain-containing protein (putative c-di-GMP-specific phosphodiesterase class I)/serine/threonine protein kinase/CheY-like chemotaxis protein
MPVKRLLIVDDDTRVCRIVERIAERSNFDVFSLDQSNRFEAAFQFFQPDVILLDLRMDQTDGVEILRFLSKTGSRARVMLISGVEERLLSTTTELGRSMGLVMEPPLRKPVSKDQLQNRLETLMENSITDSDDQREPITAKRIASAIHGDELLIHYQPIVELRSNCLIAAEALARWNHPDEGLIPPERLVSIAEDLGLIESLTSKLLVTAFENAALWKQQLPNLSLCVNISPQLLKELQFPDQIQELLRLYEFPPEKLVLEVMGGHPGDHLTNAIDVLTRLRLKNVRLAYDNFGIHSSTLEHASKLPYDILKLDRCFVSDVNQNSSTVAAARSIVQLAASMNCELVAVGIENAATRNRLFRLGCHLGQGFHIAPPMCAEDFARWAVEWEDEATSKRKGIGLSDSTRGSGFQNALPEGYSLHWYEIESILGSGGFGITYLARDTNLNRLVAIKEYFPKESATREDDSRVTPVCDDSAVDFVNGLDRFISEARTVARCQHPNIVSIYSVFEANGTAYMVMEYQRGQSLSRAMRTGVIRGERDLLALIRPLLNGLTFMHDAGFIHRDIKPDNIFIREDGVPMLLDFGAARQSVGFGTQRMTTMLTPSYAPIEQYNTSGRAEKQGPWTDIYSFGATLYRLIAGRGPIDAVSRANALLESGKDAYLSIKDSKPGGYSHALLTAIDRALAYRPSDRPQTVKEWLALFPDGPRTADQNNHRPASAHRRNGVQPPTADGRQQKSASDSTAESDEKANVSHAASPLTPHYPAAR